MLPTPLPYALQVPFFQLLAGQLPLDHWEVWLYGSTALEKAAPDLYLDLIALNFKETNVVSQIKNMLGPYLDCRQYERALLLTVLRGLLARDDSFPASLRQVYELSCTGEFDFLARLEELTYPLAFERGLVYRADWRRLPPPARESLVGAYSVPLRAEAERLIHQLQEGSLAVSGAVTQRAHFP